MKKKLALLLSAVLVVGMLAACGDKKEETAPPTETETTTPAPEQGQFKDGTYHAEAGDFDEKSGWKDTLDITVKDGKIAEVNWDAVNKEGGKTKKELGEEYGMKKAGSELEWNEQAKKMEDELIAKQDPAAIPVKDDGTQDAISGVSIHVNGFVKLAEEALASAK
ncbi:FMN-binding protein [Paenibacillus thiaminolyticus]|uniref:FMN-binding protein n=1 Tax=Paenibacillus thiaminolyticus TaxID=49283 RepID=UPI001162E280|nr:FMN-binding protein [Paenibacillus thiaminolyticus]MDG0873450.1 FMN-binding protein [Paenibacillus thiaminolyticus]NGP60260.1 FMN-binding protein [Paenibacillus thiaminolyticus]WCR26101.1 FMN-binding protein [Paenibacillus thiaminolyticus]